MSVWKRLRQGARLGSLLALSALSACNKAEAEGGSSATAAGPAVAGKADSGGRKVVPGPGESPQCFAPWKSDTKYFQWPARKGPFRLALVNGFVGNAWRIQMVKTAKAFVKDPAIAPLIKEFKVVSTGTDIAAQLGAIEDFINQGYDAIVTIAVSPTGFDRVIHLAEKKNVIFVPFDGVLDTDKVMQINEDQTAMGRQWATFLDSQLGGKGTILEVRGLQGNSVDRDRHVGFREIMEAPGKQYKIVEVVGGWDDGKAQKAVADALAVHGKFVAAFTQGGSTGALRALLDAGTSILFYSTDYDELIGCCDRVLVLYQGAVVRELVGPEITETNIVASALNIKSLRPPAPLEAG